MTQNLAVVGCGKMGMAIGYYLAQLGFGNLALHDIDEINLYNTQQYILKHLPNTKITLGLKNKNFDAIVLALEWHDTEKFIMSIIDKAVFKNEKLFVSITRPNYQQIDKYNTFNALLKENNIALFAGFGLEPGLTEIFSSYLIQKYSHHGINDVQVYCGGLPRYAKPPFFYSLLFGKKLPYQQRRAWYKKNNQVIIGQRFDGLHSVFIENVGVLEAYHDGLLPFYINSEIFANIPNYSQQTLRWSGFTNTLQTLRRCGLLDENKLVGFDLSPNDFTHMVLQHNKLLEKSEDITVLNIQLVLNNNTRIDFNLIAMFDKLLELTAMAKTTAFTACFTMKALLERLSYKNGITLPFELFSYSEVDILWKLMLSNKICKIVI